MKILITGATSGIGAAIAEKFAKEGHEIWITGRRAERLTDLQHKLTTQYKATVNTSILDVRNLSLVQDFVNTLKEKWNAPDILVNNAGLALGLAPIDKGETSDWETMIDTNIKGLLWVTRSIAPLMVLQKKGHIINIGSTAGKMAYPNGNVYCATKFAVDALSQSMRIDLMNDNIKVTAINPGMVETEFSVVRYKGDIEKANNAYQGFEPLHAEDIAESVYYCATLPQHVCINDLTITCTRQANGIFKTTDTAVLEK